MQDVKIGQINATINKQENPGLYQAELGKINSAHSRERSKYIGEGIYFLLLILSWCRLCLPLC